MNKKEVYCLKIDVSKYFYNIDHEILFDLVKKRIKDKDILELVRKTIRGDFGNGEDRRNALGSNYAEVQNQVNLNFQNGTTNWDNIRLY